MSSTAEPITERLHSSQAPSDLELVEKFLITRDPDAIATLYKRHGALVVGVCHRVLASREDREDVLQATYLVLIRDLHRLKKRKSVACWLYGVAYRLSQRVLRTRRSRQEVALVDEAGAPDTFEILSRRHDLQTLDEELNALPDKFKQVLVLRYLTDRSTSEIAKELGLSIGAVEGLLKRGKQQLRQRLLRRGVSAGIALAAVQLVQKSAGTAFGKENLDWMDWPIPHVGKVPPIPSTDLIPHSAARLAAKEIASMTTTTKSIITTGLLVGGLAVGFCTTQQLSSPHGGGANAAGISTALSMDHAVQDDMQLAVLSGDAVVQPNEKEPQPHLSAGGEGRQPLQPSTQQKDQSKYGDLIKWGYRPQSRRESRILMSLDATCDVNFVDMPLKDAISFLEASHEIPIRIDAAALEAVGTTGDTLVTLTDNQNSLSNVLDLLLEPFELDYIIKNDVMTITNKSTANRFDEVRIYDTSRISNMESSDLIQMIREIFPEAAKDRDKSSGMVAQGNNRLIVRHPRRIHEKIVDLLNKLEASEEAR